MTHSLGGGTGSGVGTYVLGLLEDLYPGIYRFSACVMPAEDDDVVTSPYNSVLATAELIKHAHCVFPIDNKALQSFAELEAAQASKRAELRRGHRNPLGAPADESRKDRGFDAMNGVAARMLCHLTGSSRFHGDMNVDMNEIYTNLVPFPRVHFLMTAISPQRATAADSGKLRYGASSSNVNATSSTTKGVIQRSFADILSRAGQLTGADPSLSNSVMISSAFITRGSLRLSDFIGCVTAAQRNTFRYVPHSQEES